MKTIFMTVVSAANIAFISMIAVFGQQNPAATTTAATAAVDIAKEFNAINRKAEQLLQGKSYRITRMTGEYAGNNATKAEEKRVSVYEVVPPDRIRYSSVYESGGTIRKREWITIGETKYVRENGGEWKINKETSKYGTAVGSWKNVKFIEKTFFNGQTVTVYEAVSDEYASNNSGWTVKTRYWFSDAGFLLKTESEETDRQTGVITKRDAVYEYDPNIKIEAPLIKSKRRKAAVKS